MSETEIRDLLNDIALNSSRISFERLYLLYYSRLFCLAKSLVKQEVVAEEIVDDVFMNLWMHRTTLTSINNFAFYCYKAVKNKSFTHISKSDIKQVPIEDISIEIVDSSITGEQRLVYEDLAKTINYSLSKLSEQCKLVFKLVKEDGLKYREVAELLDISVKTVEYHMGNALKQLANAVASSQRPINAIPAKSF
ncbi:RNA polymerase sigma-70 factor [Mucilaginibacter sp. BT774]|uniref:RNA polymerase sigma-70 factor n=1 Tax=Mucilaginibacter sp. BT774 TaxID=3062276 RepID=UPI002675E477|nr:RNA polymerase sigma-70 factor [Mucilaginibacter sp. BT774]MDO3626205.1 RNA polymerase sigma-70 factor [Mucilaginibacter sp. BT774]